MRSRPARLAPIEFNSSSQSSGASSVFQYVVLSILLALPIVIYYVTIYKNAYNFPYEDDFNSALSFISEYAYGSLSAWEKAKLVFSQYNEHRIVFDRLIFVADYRIFGQLNFRHLVLIGNLALLLICVLFMNVAFRTLPLNQKLFYLLPVVYSLFSFQYWELSTWSMAALQNLYVIPFAMFSLYSLCRSSRSAFALACMAAVVATFTSGNGMFTFIVGIGLLLFLKSYRKLVLWAVFGTITVGLYFWQYIRPPYHPDIVDSLVNHTSRAISYFFTLTGALAGPGRPRLAIFLGVLSLFITIGLLSYLWYRKRLSVYLPLIGWLLFLYLTCLSLMASRSGMGIGQAFSARYGIVVVMLFATQAVLAIETVTKRNFRLAVLTGYLGVILFFYLSATNQGNQQRIEDRTQQLQYSSAFYNDNPANLFLHWGDSEGAKPIFKDASQKAIYQVPDLTFNELKSTPKPFDPARLTATRNVTYDIVPYIADNFVVFYRSWALLNGTLSNSTQVQLVARSASDCYVFDTYKFILDDPEDHTLARQYKNPGFSCVIDKKDLKTGHYVLWTYLTDGSTKAYVPLKITLDI